MVKRANRQQKELNWQGIALVLGVVAAAYILYTNMLALIIAAFGTTILVVVAVIIGAYYILPTLGITGVAALLSLIGIGSNRK